jgi:ABC-2 type transport system permease protein
VDEEEFTTNFGVANLDGGEVAAGFVQVLRGLDFVTLRELPSAGRAEALAEAGEVDAAFVIPEGFSARAGSGRGGELRVITDPNESIGPLIATSLARSFASEIDSIQVAVATVLGPGEHDPAIAAEVVSRARETSPAAVVDADTAESRLFSSTTFYAAGMAVFFVFFTVEFGVRSLLDAPMRPAWIIGGKALASFIVGLVSMSALVLASAFLLGAEWGDPVGVASLIVSGVLAAMGLTALVATLAKTPAQASGYASTAAVVLGLLGGTFFPLSQGPSFLANLSLIAPQAWMMRGFQDLAAGGAVADALPSVGAVLAFAVVLGGVALLRSDRLVPR